MSYRYEYRLIYYVFHVAREERVNIGLVFWCPETMEFWYKVNTRYGRLSKFFPELDGRAYRRMCNSVTQSLEDAGMRVGGFWPSGEVSGSPTLDWMLEPSILTNSNVLGVGSLKAGITDEPIRRAAELFTEYVERYDQPSTTERVDNVALWQRVINQRDMSSAGLATRPFVSDEVKLEGPTYDYAFRMGWVNGTQQVAEPISFDYAKSDSMIERANTWVGRLTDLDRGAPFELTAIVHPPAGGKENDSYQRAVRLLRQAPRVRALIESDHLESLWELILKDVAQNEVDAPKDHRAMRFNE